LPNTNNFSSDILLIIESSKIEQNEVALKKLITQVINGEGLINLSFAHGTFPLLYKTLKEHSQIVPETALQTMKKKYMQLVRVNMLMSTELIKIMQLLEKNSIKAISFKGPLLSQMAYGDISSRQYVDLDILINEADIQKATTLLVNNNYVSEYSLESYQQKNLIDTVHDIAFYNVKNNIRIECHWALTSGEFYIDIKSWDLFKNPYIQSINNTPLPTITLEKLIIYLCIHGYKHMWERVEWLADIVHLNDSNTIDWNNTLRLAGEIHADRVLLSSLFLCEQILDMKLSDTIKKQMKEESKLLNISTKMLTELKYTYDKSLETSAHSKQISSIQLYMLKDTKSKFKYIKTLFIPTELDYKVVKLPKFLSFLYYAIRPFNILLKALKH